MSFNRRRFLRSASLLATASLAEFDIAAATLQLKNGGKAIQPGDEDYWKNVRSLFPLSTDKVYLNNGTMGPSPYPVIEATHKGMARCDEQGEYGGYEDCLADIARFTGAHKNEIALTHNVTEGINIVCWGLPLQRGDEVIVTDQEHVGNALPWLNRQKLHGIKVKALSPAPTAAETLQRLNELITRKTRVIAVPHIPCTTGQVLPVKEICLLARERGIYSCIDGAHGPGMLPLDLHDMGCDTYASCCHKWMLGPKGTGFVYVRGDFGAVLQPLFVGGGSAGAGWDNPHGDFCMSAYVDSAHRYFGGTQSLADSEGIRAAVSFIEEIGMDNVHARIKYLSGYLQQQLLDRNKTIELLTPTEDRSFAGVNSFRIKDINFNDFFAKAYKAGVRVRAVPENGVNCIRVSTHIYNNRAEIDRLIALF